MKFHKSLIPSNSGKRRGFTLAELMVALAGGLFIASAVFTLSKQTSRFSMSQMRVADATLGSVVGFERLRTDIARAGFLGTANVRRDPRVCGTPADAAWPAGLSNLASVQITPGAADTRSSEATDNGLTPQRILLGGSYASADQFDVRLVTRSDPAVIFLEPTSLGLANLGYTATPTAATLARVFATDRILRVVDNTGRVQFGVIASVTGGADPSITLARQPPLQFREGNPLGCGVRGNGSDLRANVVNLIRYDLVDLSEDAAFAPLFRGGPSYEATRRELVREELNARGELIAGTRELIAEYGVDLGFSLLTEPSVAAGLRRVTTTTAPAISSYAGLVSGLAAGNGPEQIRAVHAWFSVRSREADRPIELQTDTAGAGPKLLRVVVAEGTPERAFARVRSLQSTIPLMNQSTVNW
jgi:hypothetical protein